MDGIPETSFLGNAVLVLEKKRAFDRFFMADPKTYRVCGSVLWYADSYPYYPGK
jgi:hypothetical protein